MKKVILSLAVLSAVFAAPVYARLNMLEPWSPGLDFRIPQNTWNHDAHARMGFGKRGTDVFELGYLLSVPLQKDWEVGGGIDFRAYDRRGGSDSGLSDLSLGAKYKVPKAYMAPALEAFGETGITLPTGDADDGLGIGGLGFYLSGGLQGALADNVTAYTHLGYRINLKGQDWDHGDVLNYTFGLKYRVDQEWIATADVRGFNQGRTKYKGFRVSGRQEETYLAPGAVYRPGAGRVEYLGAVLLGLSSDAYDLGLQVSAKF